MGVKVGGGVAVAAPLVAPVSSALSRVGTLPSGMVSGSVLEAGLREPSGISATADTR
jgi:hypothetical protein